MSKVVLIRLKFLYKTSYQNNFAHANCMSKVVLIRLKFLYKTGLRKSVLDE